MPGTWLREIKLMKPLIYLAVPFTHNEKWVQHLRYLLVTAIGDLLIRAGKDIFSPITESYMYQTIGNTGGTFSTWKAHDFLMLSKCDKLLVLTLPGWKESIGVTAEIQYARRHKIPIEYLSVHELLPTLKEVI